MKHDPFYQQIIDGLCRPLDPDTFEHCASALLRTEWPTLVPIRGGHDSGMDGAIADAQGEPFPLVCTTGEDVIGNLTRSLESYLADGGRRRRVIVATSQSLTPPRRRGLQRRATEKGFELVQIYDRAAFAVLLYRSPEWCKELLGLTGNASALSVVPLTQRPLLDTPLIGRDEDLTWLLQTTQDALVFGVPGCGKTALLHALAKKNEGLFVVSEDRGAIAADLRAQQPKRLIVDDAHLNPDLLVSLRQLRAEVGADFPIIASCWPGERDAVLEALQIPRASAREIKLLIRDEIVKVIQAAGVRGPQTLVREIVDQAEGRPGLAITLSHLCLQGGVHEVALGHALSRSLRATFEPLVGGEATEILAILSLGGRSGMPVGTVAKLLDLPLIQVRRRLVALAAGGVIDEVGPNHDLAVRPPVLRHALVRDIFFSGAARLPVEPFLPQVPDPDQAISVLIGARARGGDVPHSLLERLLEQAGSAHLWAEFASLGVPEATQVLTRHPDFILAAARPILHHVPERAIPHLLQAAGGDQRPLHLCPEDPLRIIEDWIYQGVPGTGEALRRRRTLVRSIGQWLRTGGNPDAVAPLLNCAISPQFRTMGRDPGSGRTLTVTRGLLTPAEIEELASVSEAVAAFIGEMGVSTLKTFFPAVEDLVYPGRRAPWGAPDDAHEAARKLARVIVTDLAHIVSGQNGFAQRLQPLADHLDLQLEQRVDADFAALYPAHRPISVEAQEKQATDVRALAGSWADRNPDEIVHRLLSIENEASAAGLRSAHWTPFLCAELARRVACPRRWAGAMVRASLPVEAVSPFIARCTQGQEEGWEDLVRSCLSQPSLQRCAVLAVLTLTEPPQDLLEIALSLLPEMSDLVEQQCITGAVSPAVIPNLLAHGAAVVGGAAARGLWSNDSGARITDELRPLWRRAILRLGPDELPMGGVLQHDSELAFEWLRLYVADDERHLIGMPHEVEVAITALPEAARGELLAHVATGLLGEGVVHLLVSDSLSVYRALLQTDRLRCYHLTPLARPTRACWPEMVVIALDAGYSIVDVAGAALLPSFLSYSGEMSGVWQDRMDLWSDWLNHSDERVRAVAALATQLADEARDRAREQERQREVRGEH